MKSSFRSNVGGDANFSNNSLSAKISEICGRQNFASSKVAYRDADEKCDATVVANRLNACHQKLYSAFLIAFSSSSIRNFFDYHQIVTKL
jgi:hypothetical protein